MTVNNEFGRMWEEVVVAKFKTPSRKLLDGIRKLYGKPHSGFPLFLYKFEPGAAQIHGRIVTVHPSCSVANM
jgi:hypothetical protein